MSRPGMSEPEIEEGLEPSPERDWKLDRWPPVVTWLGVFGILWLAFAQLFLSFPVLYDTDSYFHLSVGRLYADHGLVDELPWARFSALYEGFGDKEAKPHALGRAATGRGCGSLQGFGGLFA